MYLRTTSRRNADGSVVRYLQLAHNEWDATVGSRTRVLYNFGREDRLDRDAVARLIASLSRVLDPVQALTATAAAELSFVDSRPYGGAYVLDRLWRRLGVDRLLAELLTGRRRDGRAERVLFALVANRALAPSSKLAATRWVSEGVALDGLAEVDEDSCYRAMDWLLEIEPELAERVYWAVADLLNLEVDLLFFDTTSTYFEVDQPDPAVPRDEAGRVLDADAPAGAPADSEESADRAGFRVFGHSQDHRDDLPQVVIGMAVTRTGIPIRVWTWPGNTADVTLLTQVKKDLRDWRLARVVWVADRGFASAANRRMLQTAGGHYILGERLRSGSAEAAAALSRQGRYHTVAGNLRVKQVQLTDGVMRDRFVVCHNPEQAERDRVVRDQLVAGLQTRIAGTDGWSPTRRAQLRGQLRTQPGLHRFLRVTRTGLLRVDRAAVRAETTLDGKFLLRTSDPTLSAEDIALGYKQLLEVERGWRDMKTVLDLRPVYHRKEERIRAHVLLSWLALLLIRLTETATGRRWPALREDLQRMHVGTFAGPAGVFRQRTETTVDQRTIFTDLGLPEPARILTLQAEADSAPAKAS
jgi:Transposase DDE domain